ncbi:MAG: FG-GAP-like repeat-containing protein, partial [Bacteroidota bacterium]
MMNSTQNSLIHLLCKKAGVALIAFSAMSFTAFSQTTWTEDAAGYGLSLGGNKDGGFAFCDFDLDDDFDVIVNTNNRSFLYVNNGNGTFTDQTNTLAQALSWSTRERCAVWGDLNNDGYPDFARNTSFGGIEVFLQDPATNRLGDGNGGFGTQVYNGSGSGNFFIADGVNTEGMGFLDYNGDGYLDIVFDNHNYGVDMLENDGTGNFSHVTAKGPGYNQFDPNTWPLGLAQDATDGDYGSTTDYDNDGWVDFIARKRSQVDFFRNVEGEFVESINIDDANNGNKGAVNFSDYDNDGDFDLFWTEQGTNQIWENQAGAFIALGGSTNIPTSFGSNRIDGLACGDVDNDGDIDIFLAGDESGRLYINQINDPILGANVGTPMTFVESAETFYSGDGEGCSFVDIDNDGDLDLYVSIRGGNNRLFINQLSGTASDNYLYVDIKENRSSANMPGGVERDALGATLRLVDCNGNVISGIREINGGNGHGTQDVARIHFGLPDGPADYYILQASYPNILGEPRLQINEEIRPVDFSLHLYEIAPSVNNNNAPIGADDIIYYTEDQSVTFDAFADNGNGVDYDPDGDPLDLMSMVGTAPSNGTVIINQDGTISYTPDPGFTGIDSFTYFLTDNPICNAAGLIDEVTVELIYQGSLDNCVIGFDPYTWTQIPPNDDGSAGPLTIPFDFSLYGTDYNDIYINNNGNVSFDAPYWWYTSTGFPITTPMVAPFWGDVDTRDWGPNGYQGEVWYNITPTAVYVTWMNVGPYNAFNAATDNLQNTFTLVMTDGNDPALAPGNNVGFFYGDMGWTTGQASGGTDGFGGSPATVGINSGNGIDFVLLGLFNEDTDNYDGPGGNNDGVNYIEDGCFEFDVTNAQNFPPVALGFPADNSINICFGETENISLSFTGPETNETVSVTTNTNGWSGASILSNTSGNPATVDLELTGDAEGTYTISFAATDDHPDAETTTIDLIVNVIDCDCSAPPSLTCASDVSVNAPNGSCNASVSPGGPAIASSCFGNTAIDFDGNDDFVTFTSPMTNGDFTIEFWFQPPSSNWSGVLLDMSEDDAIQGADQHYFYIQGNQNNITFAFEDDLDTDITLSSNYDFSEVRWYHVAAVGGFNRTGEHRLFVDGVQVANSGTDTGDLPSTYSVPRIGNEASPYGSTESAFGGLIDNFRMYDLAMNASRVDEAKCGDISNFPNNLLLFFDFEDGTGSSIATDVSPGSSNGTLVNTDNNAVWTTSDLLLECMTITNDYTGTDDASGIYPVGTTTVTWTATNAAGNSGTCTQQVTVVDNQNPQVSCTSNITINTNAAGCTANVNVAAPTATDNCGIASITNNYTGGSNANGNYPVGTTTVVWTVTDVNGNTSTCSTDVTVNNNLTANAGNNQTICVGESTTITASASGGSGPYTYSWNNGLGSGASKNIS